MRPSGATPTSMRLWVGQTASQLGEHASLVVLPLIAVLTLDADRRPLGRPARGGAGADPAARAPRRRVGGPMADPHGDGAGGPRPGPGAGRRRPGRTPRRARPAGTARGRLHGRGPVGVLRRGVPGLSRTTGGTRPVDLGHQRDRGQPFGGADRRPRPGRRARVPSVGADRRRVLRPVLRGVVPFDPADPAPRIGPRAVGTGPSGLAPDPRGPALRRRGHLATDRGPGLGRLPVLLRGDDDRLSALPATGLAPVGQRRGADTRRHGAGRAPGFRAGRPAPGPVRSRRGARRRRRRSATA